MPEVSDKSQQAMIITRVGMDHLGLVAGLQVPEDGGVVEEGQVDHVLALLELRRVDSTHVGGLEVELLVGNRHDHLETS